LPALQERHSRRRRCETPRGQGRQGRQADDHHGPAAEDAGSEEIQTQEAMSRPKLFNEWPPEKQEEWKIQQRDNLRKWCRENPEKVRSYSRRYYASNRSKIVKAANKWGKENPDKRKKSIRNWHSRNPEKQKQSTIKWRSSNLERVKINQRKWYNSNINKRKKQAKTRSDQLDESYVANIMGIPISIAKKHPDLLAAKREQIKILRELKPTKRKKKEHAQEPEQPARSPR